MSTTAENFDQCHAVLSKDPDMKQFVESLKPHDTGTSEVTTPTENIHQRHVILSKNAIMKRIAEDLQKRKNEGVDVILGSEPEGRIQPYSMKTAMRRSPGRAAWAIGAPTAMGLMMGALASIPMVLFPLNTLDSHPVMGAICSVVLAVAIGAGMMTMSLSSLFTEHDAKIVEAYAVEAPHTAFALLGPQLSGEDLQNQVSFLIALQQDVRKETAQVRRRTVSTIAAIKEAHDDAQAALGTASTAEIDADAATAIMTTLDAARRDVAFLETGIKERDATVALPVAEEFSARMAQLASGAIRAAGPLRPALTGNAVASRIVENARKALEIDPEMVDDAGARVDALIDRHLPELLGRHAAAARHARVEDLRSINADLENGIELIRRSVEEGLSRIRTAKAEALRTEIAFLQSRRGESDPRLNAIPQAVHHIG